MDCVWTDQLALPQTVSRFNKDNDPNVYFCTETEQSDHSTEHTCIGVISFSSATPQRYISTGFIIINQSKSFYQTATTVMRRRNATLEPWESTRSDQSIGTYVLFYSQMHNAFTVH